MGAELLRVPGLRRRFGDDEVLHGVSLAGGPGQAVDVVGPNGTGKSTLLNEWGGLQCGDGSALDGARPPGENGPARTAARSIPSNSPGDSRAGCVRQIQPSARARWAASCRLAAPS